MKGPKSYGMCGKRPVDKHLKRAVLDEKLRQEPTEPEYDPQEWVPPEKDVDSKTMSYFPAFLTAWEEALSWCDADHPEPHRGSFKWGFVKGWDTRGAEERKRAGGLLKALREIEALPPLRELERRRIARAALAEYGKGGI